ncbi:MAG: tetratricopeptide repeat protein, partial [Verrucomicrobiota bacterium]
NIRFNLGQVCRHQAEPKKALENYERAKELAEMLGEEGESRLVAGNIGLVHVDLGHYDEAIETLTAVVEKYQDHREWASDDRLRWLGLAYFNLAYAHYRAGQLDLAQWNSDEALRILGLTNDRNGIEEITSQVREWNLPSSR